MTSGSTTGDNMQKQKWSPAQRAKFKKTMAAKAAKRSHHKKPNGQSIPLDLLPEKVTPRPKPASHPPRASIDIAKLQLAHEVVSLLSAILR
jgi:hypothetical protein